MGQYCYYTTTILRCQVGSNGISNSLAPKRLGSRFMPRFSINRTDLSSTHTIGSRRLCPQQLAVVHTPYHHNRWTWSKIQRSTSTRLSDQGSLTATAASYVPNCTLRQPHMRLYGEGDWALTTEVFGIHNLQSLVTALVVCATPIMSYRSRHITKFDTKLRVFLLNFHRVYTPGLLTS